MDKLKPKNNYREVDNICPNCMSRLEVNDIGELVCTGDKLEIWVPEFKKIKDMNSTIREAFMDTICDSEYFKELYRRWLAGKLECDYSNQIYNIVNRSKSIIPDPIVVQRIEGALKRKLTEDELLGDKEVLVNGKIQRIPLISLPEDG